MKGMSLTRKDIIKALKDRGFTGTIDLYFWRSDGWYCDCDQMMHDWIGQNVRHVLIRINRGDFDGWIEKRSPSKHYKTK